MLWCTILLYDAYKIKRIKLYFFAFLFSLHVCSRLNSTRLLHYYVLYVLVCVYLSSERHRRIRISNEQMRLLRKWKLRNKKHHWVSHHKLYLVLILPLLWSLEKVFIVYTHTTSDKQQCAVIHWVNKRII